MASDVRTVTLIPGDGNGPEIAVAVQKIFAAAEAPIAWDPVDVSPVRNADGTMGIPQAAIDSVNTHNGSLRNSHCAICVPDRADIHRVPSNWSLSSGKDLLDSHSNLRSNSIARNQGDCSHIAGH